MQNLMENLNKEQLEAVQHKNGPLLIVAGAGTGKTTVITQKIAYLIEQGYAESDEILALTFTEKAAGEMEERVDQLLPMGYLDLWVSTFHSFGERILRQHGIKIGLPGDFKLLAEFEQYSLIRKNLDKFELDYYKPLGNPTKFLRDLISHFSRAKDEDISPAEYLEYAQELKENLDSMLGGEIKAKIKKSKLLSLSNITDSAGEIDKEMAEQEILRINEVANAYHVYQQLLLDSNALDFGDLINYTLKLLRERPVVLEKYRQQFKYILLDEFQDTNLAQYELIKLLAAPKNNLAVVGDDDQSIYRFRGASMSNILQFQKDFPKAKQIFLNQNYRNKQGILDASYEFIKLNNPNRLEYEINKNSKSKSNSFSKKLKAAQKGKAIIDIIQGSDLNDEVRQVVEKIAELKIEDKEAGWGDFAILVRANESAKEFSNALEIAGLPYHFFSSRGLYARPVIMDAISYLKLLDNYHESTAVFRILNLPMFSFTYRELVNFNYFSRKKAWSLYEVLKNFPNVSIDLRKKINNVLFLVDKHTALTRDKSVLEIFLAFVNESGYLKHLMSLEDQKAQESIALLNQFLKRIKSFEAGSDDKSIKAFLNDLNMEIEAGEQGSLPFDLESGPESIKIMTVHAAKGLEYKYVFVVNMVDKRFPTIRRKESILIPDDLVKEILPEGDIHTEEERRLLYVAMTRAKDSLYFSWAPDYGTARKKKPSRFLIELGLAGEQGKKQIAQEQNGLEQKQKITSTGPNKIKPPSYFSHTQLTAFKNCPYQYYFAHILKVPTRGKYVFSFGQAMHLTLQKLFELIQEKKGLGQADLFSKKENTKNNQISWNEILDLYESCWVDDWYDSAQDKKEYYNKGRDILKAFYEKHKNRWPEALSLEQGVNLKLGGYRIFGKIDRVDNLGNEQVQIVDYKTGKPKSGDKISLEDKEQLLLYQMAVQQAMDKEIKNLQFYYLDDNSEVDFLGSEKDLEIMEGKIIKRIKSIEEACRSGVFEPKPGPLCKFCDFKDICEFRKF